MKNFIITLFIISSFTLNAQDTIPHFVKLTSLEIKSLEKELDWQSDDILIINFISPIKVSDSDDKKNITKTIEFWNDFYKKIDLTKAKNTFAYSDCLSKNQKVGGMNIYIDENNIIRNIFFPRDKLCSGIAVINKTGDFKIKYGKYSREEIENFISSLKNN